MISNVFKCVSICFEFASTAEWQQLTHWVNTKAGIKFQNHSKQSLWFFVHKKELHIFIARNSISANKKIGNSELFGCSFLYYKKKMILRQLLNCASYTIQRKISVVFFFINFYTKDMYIPDYIQWLMRQCLVDVVIDKLPPLHISTLLNIASFYQYSVLKGSVDMFPLLLIHSKKLGQWKWSC